MNARYSATLEIYYKDKPAGKITTFIEMLKQKIGSIDPKDKYFSDSHEKLLIGVADKSSLYSFKISDIKKFLDSFEKENESWWFSSSNVNFPLLEVFVRLLDSNLNRSDELVISGKYVATDRKSKRIIGMGAAIKREDDNRNYLAPIQEIYSSYSCIVNAVRETVRSGKVKSVIVNKKDAFYTNSLEMPHIGDRVHPVGLGTSGKVFEHTLEIDTILFGQNSMPLAVTVKGCNAVYGKGEFFLRESPKTPKSFGHMWFDRYFADFDHSHKPEDVERYYQSKIRNKDI